MFWKKKKTELTEDESSVNVETLVRQMPRQELVLTYVFGIIEGLIDKGIMSGDKVMTPTGKKLYKLLQQQRFQPTEKEYEWAMAQFKGHSA